jgi:drug/metabolite transporter (DMT)-like permease
LPVDREGVKFDLMGIPLVIIALLIDAGIGPVQEYCLRTFDTPKAALVGYAYIGGCIINLVTAAYSGDLQGAWDFLHEQAAANAEAGEPPPPLGFATPLLLVILLATISFFGVSLIVSIVDEFGAVVANLAATARKAFTLSVSFLFFPKPFTTVHAIGTYAIV